MGTLDSINALLWVSYKQNEHIHDIISKGHSFGFTYIINKDFLNEREASEYVIQNKVLKVIFQDTQFDLAFTNQEGHLLVTMARLSGNWKRKYFDVASPEIDLHRYIRLMLDLLTDYKPFEFKTGPIQPIEGRF